MSWNDRMEALKKRRAELLKKLDEGIDAYDRAVVEVPAKIDKAFEPVDAAADLVGEEIDDAIATAKGNLVAMRENIRLKSERTESRINSKLIEAQYNIKATREEIEARKDAATQAEAEANIVDMLDYAAYCQDLAVLLAEESKVATLEAAEMISAYEERYGEQ